MNVFWWIRNWDQPSEPSGKKKKKKAGFQVFFGWGSEVNVSSPYMYIHEIHIDPVRSLNMSPTADKLFLLFLCMRSKVGRVINRWLPKCLNLLSLDWTIIMNRKGAPCIRSDVAGSLPKNWSYTSNQCIYFSILLDWRAHLAKTLFLLHKYIKCALL